MKLGDSGLLTGWEMVACGWEIDGNVLADISRVQEALNQKC